MYKIIKNNGDLIGISDNVNYICKHPDGFYILTNKENATGVAFQGSTYMFYDGVILCEIDGFDLVTNEDAKNREAVEQSITELYLDGIQTQQDITDIQLQLLEG